MAVVADLANVAGGMMSMSMSAGVGDRGDMGDGSMGHWGNMVMAAVDNWGSMVVRSIGHSWGSMGVRVMGNWGGMDMDGLGNDLVHWLSDLHVGWLTTDDGVESGVMIGMVIDDTLVAIGIDQAVLSMDLISVAGLVLALDVSGVLIMDGVRELVVGRSVVLDFLHNGVMDWSSVDGGHVVNWSGMDSSYVMHWSGMMMGRSVQLEALVGRGVSNVSMLRDYTGAGNSDQGGQKDEL